jgi:hypothetical protein
MVTLEIEVNAELLKAVESLAFRHYGDAESSSITRVGEAAIAMRLLWLDLLEPAGHEVEEPVVEWGTEGHGTPGETGPEVREWLFGRR